MTIMNYNKSVCILLKFYLRCSGIFRILKKFIDKMCLIRIFFNHAAFNAAH